MDFLPLAIIFVRRQIVQCFVGTDVVVGILPRFELPIQFLCDEGQVFHLAELLTTRPIGPLCAPVHLRIPWRVYEQLNLEAPAGFFELVHELRAAIDLDGLDRERKLRLQVMEEVGSSGAGLSPVDQERAVFYRHVPGTKVETHFVGDEPHLKRVHLDQVPFATTRLDNPFQQGFGFLRRAAWMRSVIGV
jgi:hypothetical protein